MDLHIEMSILNQERPIAYFNDDTKIPTKVVLHFRRTKWETLPTGFDICPKFQIDKIVDKLSRRGITVVLAHWVGHDSEFYSWIPTIFLRKYGYSQKSVLSHSVQQRLE